MGQGGREDRLAEVAPASRLRSLTPLLGGRKDLRVVVPQPSHEQGLREIVCHRRGVRLCSHDTLDGKAASPCLGIFKQSLVLQPQLAEVGFAMMADAARGATMMQTTRAWARELERLHARITHRFRRAEPRRRSLAYLKALAASVERKNGWQMAEAVGDRAPQMVCKDCSTRRSGTQIWYATTCASTWSSTSQTSGRCSSSTRPAS